MQHLPAINVIITICSMCTQFWQIEISLHGVQTTLCNNESL